MQVHASVQACVLHPSRGKAFSSRVGGWIERVSFFDVQKCADISASPGKKSKQQQQQNPGLMHI